MRVNCPCRFSKDPVEMGQDWAMLSLRVEMSPCHVAAWPCMAHCAKWQKHLQQKGFGPAGSMSSRHDPKARNLLIHAFKHDCGDPDRTGFLMNSRNVTQISWCKLTLETLWLCNKFFLPAGIHPEFIPFYFGTLPVLEGRYVATQGFCRQDVSWWEAL